MKVAVSIVLYHNDDDILKSIQCVLECKLVAKLYLIDNSCNDDLKRIATDPRIDYIFNNKNLGYGSAHNIAITKALTEGMKYHVILNPDITFKNGVLEHIHDYLEKHPDIGSLMPNVFYEDRSLQRLCKLLPTPFDLIGRRFLGHTKWAKKQNSRYELHNFGYDKVLRTPCLSGCFMFVRCSVFEKSGLFDPRFFMYLEDYDLNRRINRYAKTIFYPHVSIIHGHAKESYKSGRLLKIHIQSAVRYFNKWGWFFDKERRKLNSGVLKDIEQRN